MSTTLFHCGGNVGLGFDPSECYFTVEENGVRNDWPIAETLPRIGEFSDAAQALILSDCAVQTKNSLSKHADQEYK